MQNNFEKEEQSWKTIIDLFEDVILGLHQSRQCSISMKIDK
jgi:hypothetical protein